MPKIVELRQDRNLLRANFDGYKLSLDPVPVLRQELPAAPHKAEVNEDQYSLLHAELFSMQNLLQVDPWARTCCYFVTHLGEVMRSCYNENSGRQEALQVVYRIAKAGAFVSRIKGDYNYSIRFISEKYCVLCDGINQLLLLETGDRLKAVEWKLMTHASINADAIEATTPARNFTLYDARLDIVDEEKQISLALGRVQRVESADGGCSHYIHLHWCKWICKDTWSLMILDTLESKGSLYYCAFEPRAKSLIISSNHEFIFRSQKIKVGAAPPVATEMPHLNAETSEIGGFTWTQTDDDLVVKFDAKDGKETSDYHIKQTVDKLTVNCNDETLLDHELFAKVDQDLTTWTMENSYLQVTLVKQTPSLYWPSLLSAGVGPKENLDGDNQSCMPMEQKPIANLEAPIEECDFPIGSIGEEIQINRYHLESTTVSHTVLLGSTPPLFSTNLRAGFPNALAIRQDVDAGLWLQQYNPNKADEWALRHEGNLHAFGYVQASKQQKKFMDCSPDLNYALICESHRHVFLYKSSYDGAGGLRNRSGPQVTLGKQHLITLEDAGEVLGLATAPSVVTLLTERCILHLKLN